MLVVAEVVLLLVALVGLLLDGEVLAALAGLLLWPKQRPPRLRDNAAIVSVFVIISILSFEVNVALCSARSTRLNAQLDDFDINMREVFRQDLN